MAPATDRFQLRLNPAQSIDSGHPDKCDFGDEEQRGGHEGPVPLPPVQVNEDIAGREGDDEHAETVSVPLHAGSCCGRSSRCISPEVPSTCTRVPAGNSWVAAGTPTTTGPPNSRARMARCESGLPVSATRPGGPGQVDGGIGVEGRHDQDSAVRGSAVADVDDARAAATASRLACLTCAVRATRPPLTGKLDRHRTTVWVEPERGWKPQIGWLSGLTPGDIRCVAMQERSDQIGQTDVAYVRRIGQDGGGRQPGTGLPGRSGTELMDPADAQPGFLAQRQLAQAGNPLLSESLWVGERLRPALGSGRWRGEGEQDGLTLGQLPNGGTRQLPPGQNAQRDRGGGEITVARHEQTGQNLMRVQGNESAARPREQRR